MKSDSLYFVLLTLTCLFLENMALSQTTSPFEFFSPSEKDSIISSFRDIVESDVPCVERTFDDVLKAARGMYIYPQVKKKFDKNTLCLQIYEAADEKQSPLVQDDSLTAWGNLAAERYALSIQDILQLKKGEKLNLILMDRNVGDYLAGTKFGSRIDPTKEGFSYAIYTHKSGLTGTWERTDLGEVIENFTWQINLSSLGFNDFWGPIPRDLTIENLDTRIKVGWRGPAITREDAQKMPKFVTHYDNWWNDYLPFRTHDFLISMKK